MNYYDHAAWQAALLAAGFVRANGDRTLCHPDKLTAHLGDDWVEFACDTAPATSADGASPGLWKTLSSNDCTRRVAHLPLWAANNDDDSDDPTTATPAHLIEWSVSTCKGGLPSGWRPPPRELVEAWVPSGGLSVQVGASVCQGELILSDTRWVVRFVVCSLPSAVASERRAVLKDLLIPDAERLWRLVGFAWGITDERHEVCRVVTDLSGAPHSESLFRIAYEACTHAVRWLAPVASHLADPKLKLRTLDLASFSHAIHSTIKHTSPKEKYDNKSSNASTTPRLT